MVVNGLWEKRVIFLLGCDYSGCPTFTHVQAAPTGSSGLFTKEEKDMKLGHGHIEENFLGELESRVGNGYDQNVFSTNKSKLLYSEKLRRPLFWMESEQTNNHS